MFRIKSKVFFPFNLMKNFGIMHHLGIMWLVLFSVVDRGENRILIF